MHTVRLIKRSPKHYTIDGKRVFPNSGVRVTESVYSDMVIAAGEGASHEELVDIANLRSTETESLDDGDPTLTVEEE